LSRTYLAHHELESNFIIIIIIIIISIIIIIVIIIEPDARRAHPKSLAHHAGEDEGHDLVEVGLQLHCLIAHQAAQCLHTKVTL